MNIVVAVVFGVNANKWRETKLTSRGYDHGDTVNASNPDAALALWMKGGQQATTEQSVSLGQFVRNEPVKAFSAVASSQLKLENSAQEAT